MARYMNVRGYNPENPFVAHVLLDYPETRTCGEDIEGNILVVPPFIDGNALRLSNSDVGITMQHLVTTSHGTRLDFWCENVPQIKSDTDEVVMTPDELVGYVVRGLLDFLGETTVESFLKQHVE